MLEIQVTKAHVCQDIYIYYNIYTHCLVPHFLIGYVYDLHTCKAKLNLKAQNAATLASKNAPDSEPETEKAQTPKPKVHYSNSNIILVDYSIL